MMTAKALTSGLLGACALTLIHETARRALPRAPRMDILGMRAIEGILERTGHEPPSDSTLHRGALVGDVLANTLYYSLVGLGAPEGAVLRGGALGLAAGVGGVVLPGPLGLGTGPSGRTAATALMTAAWYLAGGLTAGAAYRFLQRRI